MTGDRPAWAFSRLTPEAREMAEAEAALAERSLSDWLHSRVREAAEAQLGPLRPDGDPNARRELATLGRFTTLVPTALLRIGELGSRSSMDRDPPAALMRSIAEQGIMIPLVVRRDPDNSETYEIVAGARRWNTANRQGLAEVPVVVSSFTDGEALLVSLAENLGQEDFSPLDEASAYLRLLTTYAMPPAKLADTIDRNAGAIALTMRTLALPAPVRHAIEDGRLGRRDVPGLIEAADPVVLAARLIDARVEAEEPDDRVHLNQSASRIAALAAGEAGLSLDAWIERAILGEAVAPIPPEPDPGPEVPIEQSLSALIRAARRHAGLRIGPGPDSSPED